MSSKFPYSQPTENGINYIRNSVKAAIKAYDGGMKFYMADREDPIIRTISKIFPGTHYTRIRKGLFKGKSVKIYNSKFTLTDKFFSATVAPKR